jgi:serine/threonine protein kinase
MSHTNVPAIYDVKFSDESMRLYFEYVEGDTLRQIISGGAYPSMDEATRWFIQVASALDHAHNMGIVHRDLKPENIVTPISLEV